MKNGIIIKGAAYEAHKWRITIETIYESPCSLCDYKRRCGPSINPCGIFEGKDYGVYFKKVKED